MPLLTKRLQWSAQVSQQHLEGKLVRWYSYNYDGRIKNAGHGIVIKQVGFSFDKEEDELNTFEILINGGIEIFVRKDFEIVEQEISHDESEKE